MGSDASLEPEAEAEGRKPRHGAEKVLLDSRNPIVEPRERGVPRRVEVRYVAEIRRIDELSEAVSHRSQLVAFVADGRHSRRDSRSSRKPTRGAPVRENAMDGLSRKRATKLAE